MKMKQWTKKRDISGTLHSVSCDPLPLYLSRTFLGSAAKMLFNMYINCTPLLGLGILLWKKQSAIEEISTHQKSLLIF